MIADTPKPPARIVHLVDDDESMLTALSRLLTAAGHEVRSFPSAEAFLSRDDPSARGCVVVDLRMHGMDGLQLQSRLAASTNPMPLIVLTAHGDVSASVHAMKAGAEDFLTKPVKPEDLLGAVERALVRDAEAAEQRRTREDLHQRFQSLTPREREILQRIIDGKLNKEIAAELGSAERTIKAHRGSIMAKLRANSPAELGWIARDAGWLGT